MANAKLKYLQNQFRISIIIETVRYKYLNKIPEAATGACSIKKVSLFTGKHLFQSLFDFLFVSQDLQCLQANNFMKNCLIIFILTLIVNIIKMFLMKFSSDLDDISINEVGTHSKKAQKYWHNRLMCSNIFYSIKTVSLVF